MREKNTGYGHFVCLLIAFLMVLSSLGIADVAYAEEVPMPPFPPVIPPQNITESNLSTTFVTVTAITTDKSVIHLDEYVTLFLTIENTGGSTGDNNYTASISQTIVEIEILKNETTGQAKKVLLGKAITELNSALSAISYEERVGSIENVRKAIVFLESAGKMGVDIEYVAIGLATTVKNKVDTIITEAETNFGSAHPDVINAKQLYGQAIVKFNAGKFTPALALFKTAFVKVLDAYECNAYVTVMDFIPDVYEAEIGTFTFNSLKAENDANGEIVWHPTELGIHYIKVIISGEYMVYNSPGTTVESPPTI